MSARFIVADVFDGLAQLEDGSVDLVVTSPPFLALRSYLPADHPAKGKEIGGEATPAEFIDTLLRITGELRRVLAPHGSICVELGDTYAGSGGAGGDYDRNGMRDGQPRWVGSAAWARTDDGAQRHPSGHGPGWPEAKSKTLVPELFRVSLAYGVNPLTGAESPAGRWRVRNVVTWARPNPPVGALGDKWRPATSDVVVACLSKDRYWDDLATRRPNTHRRNASGVSERENTTPSGQRDGNWNTLAITDDKNPAGAPLLDYWEIPPGGYKGAHYAVYPPELVAPFVKAMCPERVCTTCGQPSRRIVVTTQLDTGRRTNGPQSIERKWVEGGSAGFSTRTISQHSEVGWSDCGHDTWRTGVVLDPFAGSGTTLQVATGHGFDAIGIDLDERNLDLARERVGMFLEEPV